MIDQTNLTEKKSMPEHSGQHKYLDSEALLKGKKEVIIMHGNVEYRLRKTAQDKLILTK